MKDEKPERRAMPAGSFSSELRQLLHFIARAHVPALVGCQKEGGYVSVHPETAPGSRAFLLLSCWVLQRLGLELGREGALVRKSKCREFISSVFSFLGSEQAQKSFTCIILRQTKPRPQA